MATPEQQNNLWREEKNQMLRDKQVQGKEFRRRPVALSFGGGAKTKREPAIKPARFNEPSNDDAFLRKRLGI